MINVFRSSRFRIIIPNETINNATNSANNVHKFRFFNPRRTFIGETYIGTGKTTGHIINKPSSKNTFIETVSTKGFRLTNGWMVVGPAIFFPHTIISWNIASVNDITKESLALFSVLNPKIDTLFLGVGDKIECSYENVKVLFKICKELKINFEIMATINAAATFNFCLLDNRLIAAALIPPFRLPSLLGIDAVDKSKLPQVQAGN